MRDYGKVHASFWDSPNIRAMSEDGRTLALYLLTCKHGTIAGVFRAPDGYVCEDMQWTPERVAKGFTELFDNGFCNRCETTKWVWVTKHLEWNPPENPNQIKAAAKMAAQIPDSCDWKASFIGEHGVSLGLVTPKTEPLPNPSGTLPQPVTVTVTEAVTGKKDKSAAPPSILKPDDVDQQTWDDWKQHRKTKKAPVTLTVVDGARSEAAKAGMTLESFLKVWCRRGSQGLEAAWLKPDARNPTANKQEALEQRNRAVAQRWASGGNISGASDASI